ncbi:hypothetical protein BDF19DRAFT_494061 [Syncephalis fuscata]|nr:hypothetical protein BDF19DRAFT_494061 [Syncephalis fuscata]
MINLNKIIGAENTRVEPSSINIGYSYAKVVNVAIKISSLSATSLSYSFSRIPNAPVPKSRPTSNISSRQHTTETASLLEFINLQPYQIIDITVQISTPKNIQKDEI